MYKDVVGVAPKGTRIGVDEAERMEYLKAFLQEVLRLYPPVGFLTRVSKREENFGGVQIPPRTRLCFSPHLLHRSPQYWDDPLSFMPERWINVSETETERRRFAFLPFSAGGRSCIGARFATIEAQIIIASLVRAFQIDIAPSQVDTQHTFTSVITMKAKPALKIAVQARD